MSWTEERIDKLKELWSKGMTASQIAEELGGVSRTGWGGRIRTCECRYQKPVPYHLATPHMSRRRQIYEGKAKILYEGPEPGTIIQYFKDDATAFNAQKKGTINGKGVINNRISEHVFTRLATSASRPTSSSA
jgi:hypothetical protein